PSAVMSIAGTGPATPSAGVPSVVMWTVSSEPEKYDNRTGRAPRSTSAWEPMLVAISRSRRSPIDLQAQLEPDGRHHEQDQHDRRADGDLRPRAPSGARARVPAGAPAGVG